MLQPTKPIARIVAVMLVGSAAVAQGKTPPKKLLFRNKSDDVTFTHAGVSRTGVQLKH